MPLRPVGAERRRVRDASSGVGWSSSRGMSRAGLSGTRHPRINVHATLESGRRLHVAEISPGPALPRGRDQGRFRWNVDLIQHNAQGEEVGRSREVVSGNFTDTWQRAIQHYETESRTLGFPPIRELPGGGGTAGGR